MNDKLKQWLNQARVQKRLRILEETHERKPDTAKGNLARPTQSVDHNTYYQCKLKKSATIVKELKDLFDGGTCCLFLKGVTINHGCLTSTQL